MRKRILSIILSLMICMLTLTGCQFVSHDYDADYIQVIATVNYSYGDVSEDRPIYKYELVSLISENYWANGVEPTDDEAYALLDTLITREVVYAEMDKLIAKGYEVDASGNYLYSDEDCIRWRGAVDAADTNEYDDYTDSNLVKETIYTSIDAELLSLRNDVLSDHDESQDTSSGTLLDTSSTTYTIQPDRYDYSDEPDVPETEVWTPQESSIPGKYGDADKISLEVQALERFTLDLIETIEDGYELYDEDLLEEAEEMYQEMIDNKEYEELYCDYLYSSYPIQYLIGDSTKRSVQMTLLEDYLYDNKVTVTEKEVEAQYDKTVASQVASYTADESAYVTALGNNELVLYTPNSDYFFTKHILLPFSDEQTAKLTAYKADPKTQDDEAGYINYREQLVNEIVVYEHVNGEDDYSTATTVESVFNEIYSAVNAKSAITSEAEQLFDDYIYLYNTDPGAFSSTTGYAMKTELDEDEDATYMEEFEEIGRELYNDYSVGQVHPEYAITDYGVHIMYYASNTDGMQGTTKAIDDWAYSVQEDTVYDILYDELVATKEAAIYTTWQNSKVIDNTVTNTNYKIYDSRFDDLYVDDDED